MAAAKPGAIGKTYYTKSDVTKYIVDNSLRQLPVQERLMETTMQHQRSRMMGDPTEIQLLANLCRVIGAKKTLDIGVFTGYSALGIALALPDDGLVVACDVSEEFTNIAKPFWKEAGVDKKIDLRIAPAAQTLQFLVDMGEEGTYDFAFIDADKTSYDSYYELCLKLLRPGGIIAIDNVLWGGKVLREPATDDHDTRCLIELNKKLATDARINVSMLNLGDGTTLAFKL